MKELLKQMMCRMHDRMGAEMPEEGGFEPLIESIDNPDPKLLASRYWLKAEQAPRGVEDYERKRGLYFHANKRGNTDVGVHIIMRTGEKRKLMADLRSDTLLDDLLEQSGNLSYHMTDL